MPLIYKSRSVLANENITNLLAGEIFEFLRYNALVEVGLNQSATGLVIDFLSGADVVAKDYAPLIKATAPIYPDDFFLKDVAAAGERLTIAVRNTTAGALTLLYGVNITPV